MVKRSFTLVAGLLFLVPLVVSAMIFTPQPAKPTEAQTPTITIVATARPSMQATATITATPTKPAVPTETSTPTYVVEIFYYSYNYPDLLAPFDVVDGVCANQERGICHTVNCWEYNVSEGRCESTMASGLDWHEYVDRIVACGFEYPLGTVFHVLAPGKLAGTYTCLDRCPACTGKKQLDFLSLFQQLPWNEELMVQVIY